MCVLVTCVGEGGGLVKIDVLVVVVLRETVYAVREMSSVWKHDVSRDV